MGQRVWHEDRLLAALAAGATVVTGSERLARAIRLAHADAQTRAGQKVWERPPVLSWRGFLADLFTRAQEAAFASDRAGQLPRCLSQAETEVVWESIVRQHTGGLLQTAAAAQAAHEAWTLLHAWRLELRDCDWIVGTDAEHFAAWAAVYRSRCRAGHWLDDAQLPDWLASECVAGRLVLPEQLVFTGFDEWTPQQLHVLEALSTAGSVVEQTSWQQDGSSQARRIGCADTEQELWCAARWARALLERNPAARIGIAVHNLSSCRAQVVRILDEVLCPTAALGATPARPYNLSLGQPLAAWPMVHDALCWLRASQSDPDFNTVSHLLRSPFSAAAEAERDARIAFELSLRTGSERVPLTRLAGLARTKSALPVWVRLMDTCIAWAADNPVRRLPSDWAQACAQLLHALGWPGQRQRDSVEHQTLEAFRDMLGELARLDTVLGAVHCSTALDWLTRLTNAQVFQPESADVPIQVLGLLETTGLRFDHLWITGLTDEVWPVSPRPNPLLPVALQRRHGLPHASAQREREFAERITARLLASADEVVVSVPMREEDRPQRPSPLIAGLSEITLENLPQANVTDHARRLFAVHPSLDTCLDDMGPALTVLQVKGGTGILKAQAACPFQAFGRYRLGAEALAVPRPGLDPLNRGKLLHEALYGIWGELKNHTTLQKLTEEARDNLIAGVLDKLLTRARQQRPETFTPRFTELERNRLTALMRSWLDIERERAPFTVELREHAQQAVIGPLSFSTRIDRMDRLADGQVAIIDYKTGDAKPGAWDGERPDEPQLPCYAVTAAEQNVGAVLFARVRPGDAGFRGYAQNQGTAPGRPSPVQDASGAPDWPGLLAGWRAALNGLAQAYAQGEARVDPKKGLQTCQTCHLASVCRIAEQDRRVETEDEDTDHGA